MCGITGYIGHQKCRAFILEGLSRLEYRGYDSAGFVCIDTSGVLCLEKAAGRLQVLVDILDDLPHDGTLGMGHTRWATHGIATRENAHPHTDCLKETAVVHNGIIEHYAQLRDELIRKNHTFLSETDTEVIVHLFEEISAKEDDICKVMAALMAKLSGAFAILLISKKYPGMLIAARRKSPLVIGIGDQEMYVASDPLVFSDKTNRLVYLPNDSFVLVKPDKILAFDAQGTPLKVAVQELNAQFYAVTKEGFEHYMLKEIYEQPQVIARTVSAYQELGDHELFERLGLSAQECGALESINLVGAGTSWHAGKIGQFFFEIISGIPAQVHLASEFRNMPFFRQENSVYIGISQSGETADTLEALRLVHEYDMHRIALTNVATSSLVQESDGYVLMYAGPELSVCSTKAFTAQLASLYWLAHVVAAQKGRMNKEGIQDGLEKLLVAGQILAVTIEQYKEEIVSRLAPFYAQYDRCIFLGRHITYPFAMESALKLKEISYIFAQSYPAGELKHGPIALIDERTPVIVFSVLDPVIYQKIVANAQEVKARRGHLLIFAFEGQDELLALADNAIVISRPAPLLEPIAMCGVMQFLMYRIACELRLPIDKPRNLAKSVTVE